MEKFSLPFYSCSLFLMLYFYICNSLSAFTRVLICDDGTSALQYLENCLYTANHWITFRLSKLNKEKKHILGISSTKTDEEVLLKICLYRLEWYLIILESFLTFRKVVINVNNSFYSALVIMSLGSRRTLQEVISCANLYEQFNRQTTS